MLRIPFRTRLDIDRTTFAAGLPWVMGAAVRTSGQWAAFDGGREQGCYHCLVADADQQQEAGCAELGILGPVVGLVALQQSLLALKYLLGASVPWGQLRLLDAWSGEHHDVAIGGHVKTAQCAKTSADKPVLVQRPQNPSHAPGDQRGGDRNPQNRGVPKIHGALGVAVTPVNGQKVTQWQGESPIRQGHHQKGKTRFFVSAQHEGSDNLYDIDHDEQRGQPQQSQGKIADIARLGVCANNRVGEQQ